MYFGIFVTFDIRVKMLVKIKDKKLMNRDKS